MPTLTNEQRRQMGADGKLLTIEVVIEENRTEKRQFFVNNKTWGEVLRFREVCFSAGIMVPVEFSAGYRPMKWRVFSPVDIISIEVARQDKYYE